MKLRWSLIDRRAIVQLLAFGFLVCAAQIADYLYAPTDFILINHFLGAGRVAIYSPAVQIDAGLLLSVTALASVILPNAALAHAREDRASLRRLYLRGTFASTAILLMCSLVVWVLSPKIFQLWFGDSMHTTRALLPLVLVHTVVGGSSAVGRSILLGMGKVKAFTIAALIAGAVNVILSCLFVAHFGLGLQGIIYGTLIAVTARCAIWMPWYVMRTLRRDHFLAPESLPPVPPPNQ